MRGTGNHAENHKEQYRLIGKVTADRANGFCRAGGNDMKKKDRVEQEVRSAFRVAKTNKIIEAACLIALGLVLLIWSGTALDVICKAIAAIFAIIGIVVVIAFFLGRSNVYGSSVGLFGGIVALVVGMYLFFNPAILASLVPTIIGMIVLVTGIVDLSESIRIVRQKSGGVAAALVIAVVEIILGVVFIIHPVFINKILMKFMAIALIADGIADIWIMLQIGKAEKPAEAIAAVAAGDVVDAEVTPLSPEGAASGAGEAAPAGEQASGKAGAMNGYTTIFRHFAEHAEQGKPAADEKHGTDAKPAAREDAAAGESAVSGETKAEEKTVNGVEADAAAVGVEANKVPFGDAGE